MAFNWQKWAAVFAVVTPTVGGLVWAQDAIVSHFATNADLTQYQNVTGQQLARIQIQVQAAQANSIRQVIGIKMDAADEDIALIRFKKHKGTATDVDLFQLQQAEQRRLRLSEQLHQVNQQFGPTAQPPVMAVGASAE